MIKEEEKAIERLNNYKEYILKCGNKKSKHFKAVVTVLNILKEKDKEIDLMAKEIKERNYNFANKNIKEIKQYFERLAEQEKGDKDGNRGKN